LAEGEDPSGGKLDGQGKKLDGPDDRSGRETSPSETTEGPAPASGPGTPGSRRFSAAGAYARQRTPDGAAGKVLLAWNRIAPFFVSAALFLSGFFAIFSPLPYLILGVTGHWAWLIAAAITNSALVYVTSGPTILQFYLLSIVTIGIVIPLLVQRRRKPESIVAWAFIAQWLAVLFLVAVYAAIHRVGMWAEVERVFTNFFDYLYASLSPEARDQLMQSFEGDAAAGLEEWRSRALIDLPGTLGVVCLIVAWFNLRVLVNLNPNRALQRVGLDRRVFNRWRNPDWLIWPTILSWAIILFGNERDSQMALNGFKILMAAYGLQGLAVMGAIFDAWKIRGFFRMAFYFMAVFLMMPLVLSIGFFDQWFDFRKKFRQT
jgi:hypothetical protein